VDRGSPARREPHHRASLWVGGNGGGSRPAERTAEATSYDPLVAGDAVAPPGYRQLLSRDAIAPIYAPEFVEAGAVSWSDDALVIGLARDDESRAYPVSHLNRHEMVIDRIAGIPVLVTW
jgi:hypothetical protein